MYFKILIINWLFSVVKLEFLSISKTIHKKIIGKLVFKAFIFLKNGFSFNICIK
ncbi:hypothetical protein HJ01_02724 [Flavobacterium frigoris PS1]|uniref:Uncharacterized protein n=1 Tax=Flavobacterium frigoris (strain PS1) TaxID=1086011 RepID=H7FU05_FLAFP|nr:hypothetical protein HJ01_02724 [Flavobacterium frigoris PS1]